MLGRTFRFLPSAEVTNLVLYVLGVGAQRYVVALYGFVLMVTHYHLAARDVRGGCVRADSFRLVSHGS